MTTDLTPSTRRARDFARLLDSAFRVPGTRFRFGLDPLLGLIPGVGDAIGGGFGVYLLILAFRRGAPPIILFRMFVRFCLDLLVGAVPLVGDLFDAAYRANVRNLDLLDRYLARPEETARSSRILVAALVIGLIALAVGAIWVAFALVGSILQGIG